jgi:hypothetical protein
MKTVHHAAANLARTNSGFRWRLGFGQLYSSQPHIDHERKTKEGSGKESDGERGRKEHREKCRDPCEERRSRLSP